MKEKSIKNKTVPIVSCYAQVGERCHVYVLDWYIEKMPLRAKEHDLFYLRPFHNVAEPSEPSYYDSPLGVHKLSKMVEEMLSAVGLDGKTNHSLPATGVSTLFEANVPEKVIQERTGHRSVKALRLYERTTSKQHEDMCKILMDCTNASKFGETASSKPVEVAPPVPISSSSGPSFGVLNHCTVNMNYTGNGCMSVSSQSKCNSSQKL